MNDTSDDWAVLGIAPTGDEAAIRRAYRERLKAAGPDRDPEGFQALRAAYERLLAGAAGETADAGGSAEAEAFDKALFAHRVAGDEAGAERLIAETFASHPPGSAVMDEIEERLFFGTALSRSLSPRLFRDLADRLDWADMQGRAARLDAERHAVILDRLAAEDWWDALHAAATADPPDRVAALLLGTPAEGVRLLASRGLDDAERQAIRQRFDEILQHNAFVLDRFDGANLALAREAVEGPPLVAEASAQPIPPAQTKAVGGAAPAAAPKPAWRRWVTPVAASLIALAALVGFLSEDSDDAPATSSSQFAADDAAQMLRDPRNDWIVRRPGPSGTTVDWSPLVLMRSAIDEVRYDFNTDTPGTTMVEESFDQLQSFVAAPQLTSIALQIKYRDGTWSEVRTYPIGEATQ